MTGMKLRTKILISFLTVIGLFAVSMSSLGFYVVKKYIVGKAQDQVSNDLKTVHVVYKKRLEKIMKTAFALASPAADFPEFKKTVGLDYLTRVDSSQTAGVQSEIVREAFRTGELAAGNRLIGKTELETMGPEACERALIEVKFTPKAMPTERKTLEKALSMECAKPFLDASGKVTGVLYGGKILNKNFQFIDEISESVFEKQLYNSKPLGTVTIFLDDVRIATNVLDSQGARAIGTRVSSAVYDKVVRKGSPWVDRAFVVTDWYLTAYEPLKDIAGNIIGILYVGILEKPFTDFGQRLLFVFLLIVAAATLLGLVLSVILTSAIAKPVTEMRDATAKISKGHLEYRLKTQMPVKELSELAASFNGMAEGLKEREERLQVANEKLGALNKSYLDMIGFVSHELKGILGSIVMNVYSVKDGYLGTLNEKQKKAIDSVAKSLDHLEGMVRNYLDLSRIEKGELEAAKTEFDLGENVIRPVLDHFEKQRQEKNVIIENLIPPGLRLSADKNLLTIACNNLLGNALKYGRVGGLITLRAESRDREIEVRFYNDGTPIAEDQKELLFKRFSRLPGAAKIKGTGLGLFIVKEIVEMHGGKVRVEPCRAGNEFIFTVSVS